MAELVALLAGVVGGGEAVPTVGCDWKLLWDEMAAMWMCRIVEMRSLKDMIIEEKGGHDGAFKVGGDELGRNNLGCRDGRQGRREE